MYITRYIRYRISASQIKLECMGSLENVSYTALILTSKHRLSGPIWLGAVTWLLGVHFMQYTTLCRSYKNNKDSILYTVMYLTVVYFYSTIKNFLVKKLLIYIKRKFLTIALTLKKFELMRRHPCIIQNTY